LGDYSGATLPLSRQGGANAENVFDFFTTNGLFQVFNNNQLIDSSGNQFATFTQVDGQLVITFGGTARPTQALVNDVASRITYKTRSNTPPSSVTIEWVFNDGNTGSQGTGGAKTVTGSVTVSITAANDLPVSSDDAISLLVNSPRVLTQFDFGTYFDAEGSPLAAVKITSLPSASYGSLQFSPDGTNWQAVSQNQIVSRSNIDSGRLRFNPSNTGSTTLNFQVGDGTAFSTTAYTLNINIQSAPSNRAPTFNPILREGVQITAIGSNASEANRIIRLSSGKYLVAGKSSAGSHNDFALARYNTDGSLDTTFGHNGTLTANWGTNSQDEIYDLVEQADGKIVVAGRATLNGDDFIVARYESNGALDLNFGNQGRTIVSLATGSGTDLLKRIFLQSDGKIIAAGVTSTSSVYSFGVVRFYANGVIDRSFGNNGSTLVSLPSGLSANMNALLQSDGKILLVGEHQPDLLERYNKEIAMVRLGSNGSLDTSFGDAGIATANFNSNVLITDVFVQSDNKILTVGRRDNWGRADILVARFLPNGSLDTGFGTGGRVFRPLPPGATGNTDIYYISDAALQSDGKIVLCGHYTPSASGSPQRLFFARLDTNGAADASFGSGGFLDLTAGLNVSGARSIWIEEDGKLVTAGFATPWNAPPNSNNYGFMIARLNANGVGDQGFGPARLGTTSSLDGTINYAAGSTPVVLDNDVFLSDLDMAALNNWEGNYTGATLTVFRPNSPGSNNGIATDVFSFSMAGSPLFSVAGNALNTLSGQTFATFSLSNGKLTINFSGPAIPTQALVNDVARRIAFSSATNSGSGSASFVLSDGTSTASGSVWVNFVNAPPVSTNDSLTMNQDSEQVLSVSDFGDYSDPEGTPLSGIQIVNSSNYLKKYNGSSWLTVSNSEVITRSEIDAGRLKFIPPAGATGSPFATITFKVRDGNDIVSTSTYTLTINVLAAAPNNAPSFAALGGTVSFTEDGPAVVLDNDVQITDAELSAANNFSGSTLTLARQGGANA
ncbi:MAG: Ig-like domain-containing protein, partial [Kiritimatiellae bacterium]|nr:Ig-like domain-containing protein [Kiritimatiellia bacterium]